MTEQNSGAIGDINYVQAPERGRRHHGRGGRTTRLTRRDGGFRPLSSRRTPLPFAAHDVGNLEEIKKYNHLRGMRRARSLSSRRSRKKSDQHATGIALYYYPKHTLPLIQQYIAEGNNPDQPGRLIQWFLPAHASLHFGASPASGYDIGSKKPSNRRTRFCEEGVILFIIIIFFDLNPSGASCNAD